MDKCSICPIRTGCDWLSEMCRLTAAEVPILRPDLIKPTRAQYLRDYDAQRRERRNRRIVDRFTTNADGVFARRRMRRLQRAGFLG